MIDSDINNIVRTVTNNMASREERVEDADAAFFQALRESGTTISAVETPNERVPITQEPIEIEVNHTVNTIKKLKIQPNSNSILQDETTSRFSNAIWYLKIQEQIITLAGLGGIGSYVSFLLSRMKPKALYIYDDDIIEAANMSGQLYGKNDIGKHKTTAMVGMVSNYANYNNMFAINEKFTIDSEASDIMICGFDNMNARRIFFRKWQEHIKNKTEEEKAKCLFIDGRLAAESIQVFCMKGTDSWRIDKYDKEWLFDDYEADETICSYKQTTFCANMIGSIITNLFVNFCANQCNPPIKRELPFFTSYEAEIMYFKTEN